MMGAAPSFGEWAAFLDAASRFLFANWLFQATGLLLAGLLVSRLPRLRPSFRHGVLATALFLAAAAPLSHLAPLPARVKLPAALAPTLVSASERAAAPGRRKAEGGRRKGTPPIGSASASLPLHRLGWLLMLAWSLIVLGRLLALIHGSWSVGRWMRRAVPVCPDRIYAACRWAVADIPVLESDRVSVPCVAGAWRPVILLPAGMAEALSTAELRHVLLHEEAHARRRDPLVFTLAALAHAGLFWHPLAALVRRRMEATAEDACDAHVLSRGVDGSAYARTLLAVLEQAAPLRALRVACPLGPERGSELRRRVARILAGVPRASRAVSGLAGAALAAAAAAGATAELGERPRAPHPHPQAAAEAAAELPAAPVSAAAEAPLVGPPVPAVSRIPLPVGPPLSAMLPSSAPAAPAPSPPGTPDTLLAEESGTVLAGARDALPRDSRCVVLVLDASSSMRRHQAEARRQVLFLARCLSPGDRFNVIAFSGCVTQFAEGPVSPNDSSFAGLERWLDALPPQSGTDAVAGLARALATPDVTSVVLISDEETAPWAPAWSRIRELVSRENRSGAVVLAVTLGADVPGGAVAWTPVGDEDVQAQQPLEPSDETAVE